MSLGNKETLQFIKDGDVCVEVGVWQGDLSRQIAQLPISRLYLIDPWRSINDVEGRLHNTDQKKLDDIYNKVRRRFFFNKKVGNGGINGYELGKITKNIIRIHE